jgi:hypothetical protein
VGAFGSYFQAGKSDPGPLGADLLEPGGHALLVYVLMASTAQPSDVVQSAVVEVVPLFARPAAMSARLWLRMRSL